jgi:hypothetical protein
MRGTALRIQTALEFRTEQCVNCHVFFAVTLDHYNRLLDKPGEAFYCPNGHKQWYTGKSDKEKLKEAERALEWEQQRVASAEARLERERKATARLKRRANRGVCPHCTRTVSQMARHIKAKHPEQIEIEAKL